MKGLLVGGLECHLVESLRANDFQMLCRILCNFQIKSYTVTQYIK